MRGRRGGGGVAHTLASNSLMKNGSREGQENKSAALSLISLPFYKSATWAIKGEMSEQNQNGVLLFIALES